MIINESLRHADADKRKLVGNASLLVTLYLIQSHGIMISRFVIR